jgi:uncharacterized protein (DUF433 family)
MNANSQNFAVYQAPEAARLLGIPGQRIKRWMSGYSSNSTGVPKAMPALWKRQYLGLNEFYIGFNDLIEIRFVDAFVRAGLSIHAVRGLLEKAKIIAQCDYPLSTCQFKTDGRTVFLEVWEADEARAIDVHNGQHAFHAVVKPSFRDLEFDAHNVTKWYVDGRNKKIVIDPNLAFGQPSVENTSIATARLYEAFVAEGDIKTVASHFEITQTEARHAIEFELKMASRH